ncbi:MAG: hypothetical protein ACM3SW_17125 [Actinomycetota bacterium]
MVRKGSIALIAALVLSLASFAAAQQKMGKTGHFTLKAPAQVGSVTLPAGDYEVTQRRSPTGHYMEFVRFTKTNFGYDGSPTFWDSQVVARVDCTTKALNAKVSKTVVEKEGTRIAGLEIKGEAISHNF